MSLGNPDRAIGGLAVRMPPGTELRPAGREDLAVAMQLAREARALPAADPQRDHRQRWEVLLNSPDTAPFLALSDGVPAGLAILHFRRRLNFATFEGWLPDIYVRPEHRSRGLGRAMLDAALAEWRLRGSHRLQVPAPAGEEACRALLERAGFTEWMVDFRLAPLTPVEAGAPPGVGIRPLDEADGPAVTRLVAEFGPHRSPVPDRMEAVLRTFRAHAAAVAAGDAGSLVAELEGAVVGACVMDWREPFWNRGRQAWIHDLVVTEPVRGRGIGRALLGAALQAAAASGASEAVLESGLRRATAHRLYEATGFARSGTTWIMQRDA